MNIYKPTPRTILWTAALLGVAMTAVSLAFNVNIYRDVAHCYAYAVAEATRGDWSYVWDVGLPPLLMMISACIAQTGISAYASLILIGGVFYVATLFPLYAFLKRFLPPLWAAWGGLAYILAPKIIRFGCSGLVESSRNFFFMVAFLYLCRLKSKPSLRDTVVFGVAMAGLSLSRAEGVIGAVTLLCLLFVGQFFGLRRNWRWREVGRALLPVVIAAGVLLIVVSPRLVYSYRITGYPTLDTRFIPYMKDYLKLDRFFTLSSNMPDWQVAKSSFQELKTGRSRFSPVAILNSLNDVARGGYELYFFPALLGLGVVMLRYRKIYDFFAIPVPAIVDRGWQWEYTCTVVFTAVHTILYHWDCSSIRYHTYVLLLYMPFTILIFGTIWQIGCRRDLRIGWILAICCGIAAVGQIWNALSFFRRPEGTRERNCARYLRMNGPAWTNVSGRRIQVFSDYPEMVFGSGFRLSNSSLIFKDRKMLAAQTEFDLAILPARSAENLPNELKALPLERILTPFDDKIAVFRHRKIDVQKQP